MAFPRIGDDFGRYHIDRQLGQGGMGVVFAATELGLGRKVALKVLAPHLAEQEEYRSRFSREASALASVDSPYIIARYGHGERDGCLYLATQYVGGGDLADLVRARGGLPVHHALTICIQIASALAAAHAAGVVHGDVTPQNVLLRPDTDAPHVYLCDFGIAHGTGPGLTHSGVVAGTISYLAPERIAGRPATASSDLYALGCILMVCLTGRAPYGGSDAQVAMQHATGPVPQLPGRDPVTRGLNRILANALAKSPESRYATATDLRLDMQHLQAELTRLSAPAPAPGPVDTQPLSFAPATAGRSMAPPATAPYPEPSRTPPLPPSQPRTPLAESLAWLWKGNWLGALATAATAWGVLFTLAALLVFGLWRPGGTSVHDRLALTTMTASLGVGDHLFLHAAGRGSSLVLVTGGTALFLGIAAFGAAAVVLRRLTRGYPGVGPALVDAARAAVIFAILLLLPLRLLRGDTEVSWIPDLNPPAHSRPSWGASAVVGFWLGLALCLVVLLAVTLLRRDWLPRPLAVAHEWVGAAGAGLLAFVVLLPVAGVVGTAAWWFTADDHLVAGVRDQGSTADILAAMVGGLGNTGFWFLTLGSGAEWGGGTHYRGGGSVSYDRLGHYADRAAGLWAAPFVMLLVLGLSALVVLRRAAAGRRLANLAAWVVLMLLAVPWLAHASSGTLNVVTHLGRTYRSAAWGGTRPGAAMMLTLAVLGVAVVAALVTGAWREVSARRPDTRAGAPDPRERFQLRG